MYLEFLDVNGVLYFVLRDQSIPSYFSHGLKVVVVRVGHRNCIGLWFLESRL